MKKRYQIDQQRAVQEFRQLAHEENPNLQMIFPMTEVVSLLQEGVGHLMREAGLAILRRAQTRALDRHLLPVPHAVAGFFSPRWSACCKKESAISCAKPGWRFSGVRRRVRSIG